MTTENSTTQAPAATLTENELFQRFIRMRITHRTSFGAVSHDYTVEDCIRDCGEWGSFLEFTDRIADALESEEYPEDWIRQLIEDLGNYLKNLQLIRWDFQLFMAKHAIDPADRLPVEPDEKNDPAAHAEWMRAYDEAEENPRYALPVSEEGEAA